MDSLLLPLIVNDEY